MNLLKDRYVYSRASAEKEFEAEQKVKYRITTITWGYSDSEHTGVIDEEHVHKNIYEMTLGEFIDDWMEHFKKHHDEDIVNITKCK